MAHDRRSHKPTIARPAVQLSHSLLQFLTPHSVPFAAIVPRTGRAPSRTRIPPSSRSCPGQFAHARMLFVYDIVGMFKPTNPKIWAPHNFVTMTQCIPPPQIANNSIWGMFLNPTLIALLSASGATKFFAQNNNFCTNNTHGRYPESGGNNVF